MKLLIYLVKNRNKKIQKKRHNSDSRLSYWEYNYNKFIKFRNKTKNLKSELSSAIISILHNELQLNGLSINDINVNEYIRVNLVKTPEIIELENLLIKYNSYYYLYRENLNYYIARNNFYYLFFSRLFKIIFFIFALNTKNYEKINRYQKYLNKNNINYLDKNNNCILYYVLVNKYYWLIPIILNLGYNINQLIERYDLSWLNKYIFNDLCNNNLSLLKNKIINYFSDRVNIFRTDECPICLENFKIYDNYIDSTDSVFGFNDEIIDDTLNNIINNQLINENKNEESVLYPCGHTICKNCKIELINIVNDAKCPICRSLFFLNV